MAQSIEESLLKAVIKDDIKAFDALTEARSGAYRLGRFPVLSLMYLYKSRRLISAYEEKFLKIPSWEALREPPAISKRFSEKAGKCLRLYLDEVVTPLEMLLILNKTGRLKRAYPLTKPSAAVKERLKRIYSIRYCLNIKFEGDGIIIDRRPLSYGEKKKIAAACLCSFLAVAVAVGAPVTAVALMPKISEGDVTKLSHIDFSSKNEYTLKKDITVPEDFSVEKVNCKINGNGRKITFGKNATLGELNGKISDAVIYSFGSPLFTSVAAGASLENVTVNVDADISVSANTAFVAGINYGIVDGVTLNVSGKAAAAEGGAAELTIGGIVLNNYYRYSALSQPVYGTVKNCTVSYSDFSLVGTSGVNAEFGGVAGVNYGYLQDCTVTGEITAETFDIAGVCTVNNGLVSGVVNAAELEQTSADGGWSPMVSGIALSNASNIAGCENRASVSAVSTFAQSGEGEMPSASAAGIAHLNSGNIEGCKNGGAITAECGGTAFIGGIAARSCTLIANCLSDGGITVAGKEIYAGGILGSSEVASNGLNVYCGFAERCISESVISVTAAGGETVCVGGVTGFVQEGAFEQYKIDENGNYVRDENGVLLTETVYFGGGVTESFFTGRCALDVSYFGNIVGAVGANIYESNSYTSGGKEYHNFEGNCYSDNSLPAVGAVVSSDGAFASVEDKGAAAAGKEEIENSETYKNILNTLLNFKK